MFERTKRFLGAGVGKACAVAGAASVALLTSGASAQWVPEEMDPVLFPVSPSSIGDTLLGGIAQIFLVAMPIGVGVALVLWLFRWLRRGGG